MERYDVRRKLGLMTIAKTQTLAFLFKECAQLLAIWAMASKILELEEETKRNREDVYLLHERLHTHILGKAKRSDNLDN